MEAAFERFIDVTSTSDADIAQLMRRYEVDIAVDLMGHTLGQRTGVLARRAAPVQVNYLGLPATMGAPYIDYLIADQFLASAEQRAWYSEQLVWLPETFQPNDDRRPLSSEPGSRSAFGLPDTGFVFCSFNRSNKITPPCFDVWMRILRSLPDSVLWLLSGNQMLDDNLRREAVNRGVDADRLVFAGEVSYADYLARYRHADLFLDTQPFNGGATVSDAISMGLPVLTYSAQCFASRMAGSALNSLGLSELMTQSWEEYEAAAVRLAGTPGQLESLRVRLRQRRTSHAFFDTDRYREHLEAAYQTMWQRNAAGLPPASFSIIATPTKGHQPGQAPRPGA
jgi:predicted O-linked N-acetylglucosamine transferase (SPINDLY family)